MIEISKFYIDGQWVAPHSATAEIIDVINPATEAVCARLTMGCADDVNTAVQAAQKAFVSFSQTSRQERLELLDRIIAAYQARISEMAELITTEMGAPKTFSQRAQAPSGLMHFTTAREILETYSFEENLDTHNIVKEPIGVVGMITPWNWPINQIACKVAPAIATGNTIILKPSEISPLSAQLFAEIMHEARVPAGVFNMVFGDGLTVGRAMSQHAGIDMMSFTGSTRAGIDVAVQSAQTVKRVSQELGGKSANIILDDVDYSTVIARDVRGATTNAGQVCSLLSRMFVPAKDIDIVKATAKEAAEAVRVGDPQNSRTHMGPLASAAQYKKVTGMIQEAIDQGAELVTGGIERPDGLETGYFVQPTVLAGVTPDMTIANEEVFGPVLSILTYDTVEDAIKIANDSPYGLSGGVSSADKKRAIDVARQLRTGMVRINGADVTPRTPFGGYKHSGNGREWGEHGFDDYVEIKSILGYFDE